MLLHEPFAPTELPNRKALAAEVGRVVAEGAAALRQNRPAGPLGAPVAAGSGGPPRGPGGRQGG